MSEPLNIGERFSLTYLRPEEAISDSSRLRRRLSKLFDKTIHRDDEAMFGNFIEEELGITFLRNGRYTSWEDVQRWELRDVLCTITLVGGYIKAYDEEHFSSYLADVSRIFSEEYAGYRVDEKGGVHPKIDAAYQASFASSVRGLEADGYSAARSYLVKADDSLLPDGDRREAIRSAFDAVENVFKITFKGAISINTKSIKEHLRPLIEKTHDDSLSKRTALKSCEALQQWVDGCHNYRHTDGQSEPSNPPEELAVALVSQGFVHVRWIADLRKQYVLV